MAEAAVVGVPDLSRIERVKAFVVTRDGKAAGRALERDLIAHCRRRLIRWSCPGEVEFREELRKTRLGKVDLAALGRTARQG